MARYPAHIFDVLSVNVGRCEKQSDVLSSLSATRTLSRNGVVGSSLRANISETTVVLSINEQGEKEKGRDEREFSWCSFLWGFGCRGTERRRAKRATAKAGTDTASGVPPDPEVVAKPRRRTYTAEYKQRILEEAEAAASSRGGLGALLRREGLYSSLQ